MKDGLLGFGKTRKAVASILLQSEEAKLQRVIRKSHSLGHRSVPEFLGVSSAEPGFIYLPEEAIKTIRAGGIIGVHEIIFGFPYQTVRLKHESNY
ncbi:MAG: hypothetical protein PHY09_12320 [Desulfuromonadaceae bacterium]|nr:hypothetical protein [Desulfuromonadaceae bacterium]MDD5105389.1 hypothetical protein [Desulfuromonadaceae bacterium]